MRAHRIRTTTAADFMSCGSVFLLNRSKRLPSSSPRTRIDPQPRRSATHNKTERFSSKDRAVRARDVANSQVLSTGERAYDLLRGAAAAVAAVALDPGDDGVRLRAALRARAQDVLHRLPDSNGFEWAQHSSASDTYGKRREQPIESRPRTYREELERVRRHDAVVVVRRQQHGWRVLAAAAARVAAGSGGGRPLLLLLPRPPHVVEGGVPA